jgi:DNA-binding MarR family transcriptional regulator
MFEELLRKEIRTFEKKMGLIQGAEIGLCKCCYEVSFLQCHMITEIGDSEQITAKELSKELNVDKGFISRALKDMKNKGYIRSEVCESDKRWNFVSLTEKGKELYDDIKKEMWGYYSDIISSIPEDKRKQVIESLILLNKSIPFHEKNSKCGCKK